MGLFRTCGPRTFALLQVYLGDSFINIWHSLSEFPEPHIGLAYSRHSINVQWRKSTSIQNHVWDVAPPRITCKLVTGGTQAGGTPNSPPWFDRGASLLEQLLEAGSSFHPPWRASLRLHSA